MRLLNQRFPRAVRGFTRYVLKAPSTGVEVTSLSFGTWVLFLSHFLIAAPLSLLGKVGCESYVLRIRRLSKATGLGTIQLAGRALSFVIHHSPEVLIRLIFNIESRFSRLQSYRRRFMKRIRLTEK
jgi:hypothetical protein